MFDEWTPPAGGEIEVSIFGRGSGESILVHIGDGKWLVIDSLRVEGKAVPLLYLDALGVDVATQVELVLATHWHDDHIHGLADTYERASAAKGVFVEAMLDDEFRKFAEKFSGVPAGKISSGVREFGRLLELMDARGWVGVDLGRAWTTLLRYPPQALSHGQPVEVEAIAPSAFDMIEFLQFLARTIAPAGVAARAPHYDRNDVSCALQIRIGSEAIVLGADLENVPDPRSGWKAVFAAQQLSQHRASLLKIPHHGSVTGHHDQIWTRLCSPRPVASLTPWARGGRRLPTRGDIDRIAALAGEAYSAAATVTSGDRHRLQAVNSVLRRSNSKIRNIDPRLGHVRHRLMQGRWTTELFGAAVELRRVAA